MRFLFAPWLDRDDYRQEAALARLLDRNVYLHLVDVTRAATRGKHRLLTDAVTLDTAAHGAGDDLTLAAVIARDELAQTLEAVGRLAPRQRRCLIRAAAGATHHEIAAAEGLSWKQAENAVNSARAKLRAAA
jgi:DNA-directed RNA polymerase specialized sigma24 family protein